MNVYGQDRAPTCAICRGNAAMLPGDSFAYLPTVGLSFAHFRCLACGHLFTAGRPSTEAERKRSHIEQSRGVRHFPSDLMDEYDAPRLPLRPELLFRDIDE